MADEQIIEWYNANLEDGKMTLDTFTKRTSKMFFEDGPGAGMIQGAVMPFLMTGNITEEGVKQFEETMKQKMEAAIAPLAEKAFNFFDKNGDGNISQAEFVAFAMTMNTEEGAVQACFDVVDTNGNGEVEACEFAEFVREIMGVIAPMAHIVVDIMDEFFKDGAVNMCVQQAFQFIDTDGDGKISLEEGQAIAGPMLQQMEAMWNQIENVPKEQLPPPMGGIKAYVEKVQNDVLPKAKEMFDAAAADGKISFEGYMEIMKAQQADACSDANFLEASMDMNPQMEQLPPQIAGMLKQAVPEAMAKLKDKFEPIAEAMFHLFSLKEEGFMTEDEFMSAQNLVMPTAAQAKFDQCWALIDTDNDGFITQEEACSFVTKVFDCLIAFAHIMVDVYAELVASCCVMAATAVIQAKAGDKGVTLEMLVEIGEAGPEAIMGYMQGSSD